MRMACLFKSLKSGFPLWLLAVLLLSTLAPPLALAAPKGEKPKGDAAAGQYAYEKICRYCHGNPAVGHLGPPIQGSSRELLEARVMHRDYPPGYHPKRATKKMPAFPHYATKLDDLYAYLNQ